jgi:hypothetical protein
MKIDAILLIDSEGLGAIERKNDADAEKKDRLMATFAMGISNLTLVNILGENMRELTQILQIAIVAITRLEQAEVTPDILIVQHLVERNDEKILSANSIVGDALEEAMNVANDNDVNLGIRDSKCLINLKRTIRDGELFKQFSAYKDGASVNSPPSEDYHLDILDLYETILNIAQKSEKREDFQQWNTLVESYWEAVKQENFMRFKDVKDLQEFIERGDYIYKVKESIDCAFKEHTDQLKGFISEQAEKMKNNEVSSELILEEVRTKLVLIPGCPSVEVCDYCSKCNETQTMLANYIEDKPSKHETNASIQSYIDRTRNWYFKLLSQLLSAKSIQRIESGKILGRIEVRLRKHLNEKGTCNEEELQSIANDIWLDIKNETSVRVTQRPIEPQILEEIKENYREGYNVLKNFKDEEIKTLVGLPALSKNIMIKIYDNIFGNTDTLNVNLAYDLEEKLKGICSELFEELKIDVFQPGLVGLMKKKVDTIISEYKLIHKIKFKTSFIWKIHQFAVQKFNHEILNAQKKWEEINDPLVILRKDKTSYMNIINIRLKNGFTYASDGSIAADCLLNAMKQKVVDLLEKKRIDKVLKEKGIYNPYPVRIKFFSQLQKEVRIGNLTQALDFFSNPKYYLEKWFTEFVDQGFKENDPQIFKEEFDKELKSVLREINRKSNVSQIIKLIDDYKSNFEGINFSAGLDPSKALKTEIEFFKNRLTERLKDGTQHELIINETKIPFPSMNQIIMNRLGCTVACPLCSALCKGERGHDLDVGSLKKHYTHHQPMGFAGIHMDQTLELVSSSCHDQKNGDSWYHNDERIYWSELRKLKMYQNWKFDKHYDQYTYDMIKYFFTQLHTAIASRLGLQPSSLKDLEVKSFWFITTEKIKNFFTFNWNLRENSSYCLKS